MTCSKKMNHKIIMFDLIFDVDNLACSRRRMQLTKSGKVTTLHCNEMGDFERLQCDEAICWCADPRTGQPEDKSRAVPEHLMTLLPCCMRAN